MGHIKSFNEFVRIVNESSDSMHYVLTYITEADRSHPVKQHIKKDEVRLYAQMVEEDETIIRAFITYGTSTIVWSKSWDARLDRDKIREYNHLYCGHPKW